MIDPKYDKKHTQERLRCEGFTVEFHENGPTLGEMLLAYIAECETLRRERDAYRLALEGLTPGGSEFVSDTERCVTWVRESSAMQHRQIVKFKRERDQARAALRECRDIALLPDERLAPGVSGKLRRKLEALDKWVSVADAALAADTPTGGGDICERYQKMGKCKWFREAYEGKSLGEPTPQEGTGEPGGEG